MSSKEITLWVDERWYDALSKHLRGSTVEDKLNDQLEKLINKLPQDEYIRISKEIRTEKQQAEQENEAAQRFAVLHVTEDGSSSYFVAREKLDMLQTAFRLRSYSRKLPENSPAHFTGMFSRIESISQEQFDTYVHERLENTGRVTGAFDIDMDKGTFDALHIMNGWQRFRIQDVSTAAYFAMKKTYASWDERWKVFLKRLDGKQITQDTDPEYISGCRTLCERDISFNGDIIQKDSLLEFYMDVTFDADKVFGTHVCTAENDDFLNLYVNYDMEARRVCDAMDVYLVRADGSEQDFKYRLSAEEQAPILSKMEDYCLEQWGVGLEEYCGQYLAEQQRVIQEMQM